MRWLLALLLPTLTGCGTEVTDLIPRPTCVDGSSYPGAGLEVSDVATTTAMTLNGNATQVDGVLRLASASKNAVGSAYFSAPLALDAQSSLLAHFAARIGGGAGTLGADGLAFVLQSSSAGPTALGLDGGGLGYQNISPSLALELDSYPNIPDPVQAGHLAWMLDGDINAGLLAYASPPFVLNDGVVRHTWVAYDAASQRLDVYMSEQPERPSTPLLTLEGTSLLATLGPSIYVGFSASAGERFNDHELVSAAWVGKPLLPLCP